MVLASRFGFGVSTPPSYILFLGASKFCQIRSWTSTMTIGCPLLKLQFLIFWLKLWLFALNKCHFMYLYKMLTIQKTDMTVLGFLGHLGAIYLPVVKHIPHLQMIMPFIFPFSSQISDTAMFDDSRGCGVLRDASPPPRTCHAIPLTSRRCASLLVFRNLVQNTT